jgi:hypothetical protein
MHQEIKDDKPCKWSDKENKCWYQMPDSKFTCKREGCRFYEYNGTQVGDGKW